MGQRLRRHGKREHGTGIDHSRQERRHERRCDCWSKLCTGWQRGHSKRHELNIGGTYVVSVCRYLVVAVAGVLPLSLSMLWWSEVGGVVFCSVAGGGFWRRAKARAKACRYVSSGVCWGGRPALARPGQSCPSSRQGGGRG
ncbi:hypothetical protein LX32DRAFT_351946 [Colletotrichum zoysiae]|uniref:Uncharacterized protein n=1 Tax=Colletotrichum zoysiae TaxID=1216348 RepID=A0AAD9HK84_9PEZI|nr:hypothetical protein LX32DRAFT_351946 [Colletotrichum zoysiae]